MVVRNTSILVQTSMLAILKLQSTMISDTRILQLFVQCFHVPNGQVSNRRLLNLSSAPCLEALYRLPLLLGADLFFGLGKTSQNN